MQMVFKAQELFLAYLLSLSPSENFTTQDKTDKTRESLGNCFGSKARCRENYTAAAAATVYSPL